jgi:phage tail-like protein
MTDTLLPQSATAFERSLTEAMDRSDNLPIPISDLATPEMAPGDFVPWLAWGLSTDLWDRDWSLAKKRSVAKAWYDLHRRKGTLAGLKQHVAFLDADLIAHKVPPEGFFAAPDVPKDELDAYIRQHPEVRVFLGRDNGSWNYADGFMADHAFSDEAAPWVFDAPFLYGRRAVLVSGGVETPLRLAIIETDSQEIEGSVLERVRRPGRGAAYSFADEFTADDSFADAFDVPPVANTYSLSRSYQHRESRLELTRVPVGLTPRDTRHERMSIPGTDPAPSICVGDFINEGFVGEDDGRFRVADVIRLIDPSIPSPVVNSGSFAGHNRVGFPAHTAELQINWRARLLRGVAIVSDQSFAGEDPASVNDTRRRNDLLTAVSIAKRLSDRVLVTFQTTRPRTMSDGIPLNRPTRLDEASLPLTL